MSKEKILDFVDSIFGRRREYVKVEYDGSFFIGEPDQIIDYVDPLEDGTFYTFSSVRMTRRQFEALPEFEGF